ANLLYISTQHQKLEDEIKQLEEKLIHLRKQKKIWWEKMVRVIYRGFLNLEELDYIESKEAEAERK
ncbi:hypothetical protein F5883DRAFT_389452, partial [Diaporthe sp. PMI_573]